MRGYDTVVIGGGTAGCVVAARLSEDPNRQVLLIEAGGSGRRPEVRIPAAFAAQFHTALDWDYQCEPEATLGGRVLAQPRGRMLGGSSSMNLMLYIRGNRLDYDGWADNGAPGWSYEQVLPYFRRSEHNDELADSYHGTVGPMHVGSTPSPDPLSFAWIDAAVAAGIPRSSDFNGAQQDGVGRPQVTQRRGARCDAASAFLTPARGRPNLTVLTGALVHRLVVRDGRAVAVEFSKRGKPDSVTATAQIVLSAGVFGSAEILQRSGIGPADHLQAMGVPVVQDLPAVGANLSEHPLIPAHFEIGSDAVGLNDVLGFGGMPKLRYLSEWLLHRTGKLTSNAGEGLAHVRSDPSLPAPDLQLLFAPVFFSADGQTHPSPAFTMGASYLTPTSRGQVLISSTDPQARARIRLNLLSQPEEVTAALRALDLLHEIGAQQPLRRHIRRPLLASLDRASKLEHIRQSAAHTFHASGTVRMGQPADSAVDERLRVYGIDGLYVADASVFPTIPRGNTGAATLMVGERCADFVRGKA
ncbi:MAG: GMC family oxidoreductase [Jatrophihabitans sp.]